MKRKTRVLLGTGLAAAAWILAVKPGGNEKKRKAFKNQFGGYDYAHRGLHDTASGIPENSLTAFAGAAANGFGMELDVHLTADNRLAVLHDSDLQRMCGAEGKAEEMTFTQLKELSLAGTAERIPSLRQVLALVNGRTPLIIELKPAGKNVRQLCEKVCWVMQDYKGAFALESFDPRVLWWFAYHRQEWFRGQLAGHQRKHGSGLHPALDFGLRNLLFNWLTAPDFIAYDVRDWKSLSLTLCRLLHRAPAVAWTVREEETFRKCRAEGTLVIFEGFQPDI